MANRDGFGIKDLVRERNSIYRAQTHDCACHSGSSNLASHGTLLRRTIRQLFLTFHTVMIARRYHQNVMPELIPAARRRGGRRPCFTL